MEQNNLDDVSRIFDARVEAISKYLNVDYKEKENPPKKLEGFHFLIRVLGYLLRFS